MNFVNKSRLTLASGSPRRAALLKQIGFRFDVKLSSIDERLNSYRSPLQHVLKLSEEKAWNVAEKVGKGIIVGADTMVVLEGKPLGKPEDRREAREMLSLLSGREHLVYTGFTLVHLPSRTSLSGHEVTRVKFRQLNQDEIDAYIQTGSSLDKAGAYGIQDDYGAVFVERIDGCFYNVMGFPVTKFYLAYKEFERRVEI